MSSNPQANAGVSSDAAHTHTHDATRSLSLSSLLTFSYLVSQLSTLNSRLSLTTLPTYIYVRDILIYVYTQRQSCLASRTAVSEVEETNRPSAMVHRPGGKMQCTRCALLHHMQCASLLQEAAQETPCSCSHSCSEYSVRTVNDAFLQLCP